MQNGGGGIVAWFARNSVAANLLMFVCIVGGIFGYFQMERKLFPVVPLPVASVTIAWPGASPQDTEEQIVLRIEEVVADIDGLDRITSIAYEGGATVNVVARDDVDIDVFLDEVKLRVDQINNLPQASFPPRVRRQEGRNQYFGITVSGDVSPKELKRITEGLRDQIARIRGAELARAVGFLDEEVSIEVTEASLRRYNLTFQDVANAIAASSINSSGGTVETDTGRVALSARNLADTAEEFNKIIVRQSAEQGMVRVGDVANVVDGFRDGNFKATYNNKPAAFIFISSPDKMDVTQFTADIRAFLDKANDPKNGILPEAVTASKLWDDSVGFNSQMSIIGSSAMMGLFLVMIILILFLRPIVAFWVVIGIITAFAGGIMILPLMGVSFNILSLFAILLVIGVVVDDAIIVGENIHREVESGRREGVDAAIVGTQLVLKPVIFGVLTTIMAFLPWAFLTGPVKAQTEQITFVVCAALVFSLIESMLILPAHLAHMKKQPEKLGPLMRVQRTIADSLLWVAANIYKPLLEFCIRFRYATVAFFLSLMMIAIALPLNGIVKGAFLPKVEGDLIFVNIEMPDGTPYSRVNQVRDQLQSAIDVLSERTKTRYEQLPDGLIDGASVIANGFDAEIEAYIGMAPPETRPKTLSTESVSNELREIMGPVLDAKKVTFDFTFNDDDSGISFNLNHPDFDTLRLAADEVKTQLATYDTTSDIVDNLSSAADEVRLELLPGAEALGVTLAEVASQLRAAYFGIEVQRLPRDGEDVRVMVRLPKADRENIDSLRNLRIRTRDGREIALAQVAKLSFGPGVNTIVRRDRVRTVGVTAALTDDVRAQIMADMEANFWPAFDRRYPQLTRGATGGADFQQRFQKELGQLSMMALLGMYILLAIAFKSYFQPLLLLTALPFAVAGAIFGHLMFGIPLAMFSIFGIAAAAGVVINDNLVLVDYINRRRGEGAGAVQAIVDAGVSRFRPILLTSLTTFVGVLPLIFERSVQAQFLKPMVVSLGSAVAFAILLSLLMVPALYAVGVEIHRIFAWAWGGKPFKNIGADYHGEVSIDEEELIGSSASDDGKGLGGMQPAE